MYIMDGDLDEGEDTRQRFAYDDIMCYLTDPVESKTSFATPETYLSYWNYAQSQSPRLARMALDYLSAPGESC